MHKLTPKLVVNVGGMFAGKSSALIAKGERHMIAGHKVLYVKPDIDNRYSEDKIVTHDGKTVEAVRVNAENSSYLFNKTVYEADVILIDEVQFFSQSILFVIKKLVDSGKVVYVAGLDLDFKAEPFQLTAYLMAMADEVNKYKAVCSDCGADSYVTAKTSGSSQRVEIGSKELYKPVCRSCYKKYKEDLL